MNALSPQISNMKGMRNSLIDWLSSKLPSNALANPPGMAVTDPGTWQGAGNALMQFAVPQPEDTMMGLMKPTIPKTLTQGLKAPKGYAYHATNEDNLYDIAKDKLRTHKPWDFTDQDMWPDGAIEKRSYWADNPENLWQFAPEGKPVILRTKLNEHFKKETTGDLYTKKLISPKAIEYLGEDNQWYQLTKINE